MNKKYYFKNLFFSLFVGSIFFYQTIKSPLPGYKQYVFLIWITGGIWLYPFAQYALEKFFRYIIPTKLAKNKFFNNSSFFRMRDYLCTPICFFLAIPISLCFSIYILFTNFNKCRK
ncbi:hypothetical protein ACLSZP_02755 [Avibacterium avium]|uniref:hypothetical protein n=1 Tax=Avibacterium avium TaxID=751 RepID=UPI0039FCB143